MEKVRIAYIGLGNRGYGLLHNCFVRMKDVDVVAVCDSYEDRTEKGAELVEKKTGKRPVASTDYRDVIGLPEVDCVVIATAWEDHLKIAVEAMRLKKFVATEVGGAYSLEDCFELVRAHEETGMHCMMLENCCYGEYELMVLNMVKLGLFGEIVHCEGGYCHDLRGEITGGEENRHYRLRNYISRNCENYPTHEIGPIAKVLKINNGNRMLTLSSNASKAVGLHEYILKKKSDDKKLVNTTFKQSDIVTTMIKCQNGETITIMLDTTLPRSYSRHFTVRGTKGSYYEDTKTVFLDGKHNFADNAPRLIWNNAKKYKRKYAHELWKKGSKKIKLLGHGGMDWMVVRSLIETVKNEAYPPIDTYDTATWMSITPLSELSIKEGGKVMEVPDFTNGKWQKKPDGILPAFNVEN